MAILLFLLFITLVLGAGVIFFDQIIAYKQTFKFPVINLSTINPWKAKPTPAPSTDQGADTQPVAPAVLPEGSHTFTFSHGDKVVGPKPQSLTIDPLTPSPDQKQTLTVTLSGTTPVTQATVYMTTDTKTEVKHVLTRISGSSTEGVWQGSWSIKDTTDTKYALRFYFKNANGIYNNTMRFR